ncbi:MAG: hypothetical protein M1836_001784 [Candelina mexicana]|nr:MAG: hypothetical protein M1836_001784 [Candelina mexicana]
MGSTTLVTFMLSKAPPGTYLVHLLGSWDNFSKPYPMHKDSQKGGGEWKGCHKFESIICDGGLEISATKRDGGLKMGGKYWYYYRLNGDLEYHDPTQPFTTTCPFLPGQSINILEVPQEIDGKGGRGYSDLTPSTPAVTSTMNPDDKYLTPRPAPVPKLSRLATSLSSLKAHNDGISPQRTGLLKLCSKSANTSPSTEKINPFERLIQNPRQPSNGDYRCTKSSPATSCNALRSALINLKHPRSAGPDLEDERGRRAFFRVEKPMVIGEPVLVSRTDKGRLCTPISSSQSAPGSRSLSPPADPDSLDPRPLRSHPIDISRRSLTSLANQQAATRSRTPSPLRHAVAVEICPYEDPSTGTRRGLSTENVTQDVPTEDSLTEAHRQQEELTFDTSITERQHDDTEKQAPLCQITVQTLDKCLPDLPAFLKPEPLKPQPHIFEFGNITKSRFSVYSTSTIESSPSLSYTSDDPKSPSFNSVFTDVDVIPPSNRVSSGPATPHFTDFSGKIGQDEQESHNHEDLTSEESSLLNEYTAIPLEGLRIESAGSRRDAACFGFQSFQGYSLPIEEQDSQLTLGKASSPTHTAPAFSVASEQQADRGFLPSWQDSTHQSLATMAELYNDLGYLGAMIT